MKACGCDKCIPPAPTTPLFWQGNSELAHGIADTVNRIITEYKRANPTFKVHGDDASDSDRQRGQLLILDRTFDPLIPLMHEYSYQVMANDLLDVSEEGLIEYTVTTEGSSEQKQVLM